jgi:hypothetical protein
MSCILDTFDDFVEAIINGETLEYTKRSSDEWRTATRGKNEALNLLWSAFTDKDVIYRVKPKTHMTEKGRVIYEDLDGVKHITHEHHTALCFKKHHAYGKFVGFVHPICMVKEEI